MRGGRAFAFALVAPFTVAGAMASDWSMWSPAVVGGYLELHGAGFVGTDTYSDPTPPDDTYVWPGYDLGGAARGTVSLGPQFSVQGDIWSDYRSWDDGAGPYSASTGGAATHLTWHAPDGQLLLGLLGSVGVSQWNDGLFGNVAGEMVYSVDNWRFYAQAGSTFGLTGDAAASHDRDLHGALVIDHFVTPNLAISAELGAGGWTSDYGQGTGVNWGAKVEFRPEDFPGSFFVAYRGAAWQRDYTTPATDVGVQHTVLAGIRFPLGETTVQDLKSTVGLSDMNASFGGLYVP